MAWFSKYFQRLWTREKPDGKKGWGALRFLVVGGVVFGFAFWALRRVEGNGSNSRATAMMGTAPKAVNPAEGNVRLREVAKAAQSTQPVQLKTEQEKSLAGSQVGMSLDGAPGGPRASGNQNSNQPNSSYFGGASVNDSPQGRGGPADPNAPIDRSNDSIFTALSSVDQSDKNDGRPQTDEDGSVATRPNSGRTAGGNPGNGFNEPSVGGASPQQGNVPIPPIESLVIRDQRAIASTQPPSQPPTEAPRKAATHWLPRGEIIPVYIMQTVETGKFPTLVEFAVAKTIWFNGKAVLPFGTRFTASAGLGVRDRITFNVDAVRRRDGLEIACNAIILGEDKATGVRAYYVPPPTMAQIAPFIGEFSQAFADMAKAHANSYTVTVAGVQVAQQPSLSQQAQELAIASASQALSGFISSQLSEIKERYASYSTVIAGSKAYVQLTANADLSALWDNSTPRGAMATVGAPSPVSTEALYRQRDVESNQQSQAFALAMQQAAAMARQSQPDNPVMQGTSAVVGGAAGQLSGQGGQQTTPAITKDPFAR